MIPIPPLKRRSYGYIGKEKPAPRQTTKLPKKRHAAIYWWHIVLFPLFIVSWILRALWRLRPKFAKRRAGSLWRPILRMGLAFSVASILLLTIFVVWVSRDLPDPDKLTDRQVAQSTKIYDRTGEHLLREIYTAEKRTLVDLEDIPKNVVDGVIATEDKIFFEHKGVRPLSIARSIVYGILGKNRVGGGASTLTQQLVKNAILTGERTLTRKLKEFVLSIRLEQVYTKEQILKIYFNEIPYGGTNYGIEAAAQSYFGKHVSDLDLPESATLAGLPKAPSRYLNNPEALKQRRDFVLARMAEEGYITEAEKETAQQSPVTLSQRTGDMTAPHFVFYVKDQLNQEFGERLVDTGGLKVITTLDFEKQLLANEAVSSSQKTLLEAKADNAALVAIDPKTGQVLAMVGSRDYNDLEIKGNFNVATQGLGRQPGSSMKPIVYALAFSKGYTPDTLLFDVSTNFAVSGAKEYRPVNYDEKEHGLVTVRQALQNSYNIPAVQMLYLVGEKDALEFAKKLGYTTLDAGNFGLSLVLGGATVHLLEHVNAYATFANNGVYHAPVAILRVEDASGNVLKEWRPNPGEEILNPEFTATLSNVLSDDATRAPTFGAGSILTLPDRPVAAKTGTTNDYKDGWTVGYTPSLAAGVWIGRTDNIPLKPGYGGSKVAGVIWNSFMKNTLSGTPVEQFPEPPPNTATRPILRGAIGGNVTVTINRVTGKIATSSTPAEDLVERTFIPAHSILHYIDKKDPSGPPPADPNSDPQYAIWETAIRDWILRMRKDNPDWNVAFEDPPTEYDTPDSLFLVPSLIVTYPTPNTTLTSRRITTDIQTNAPRGVAKVTYKIDGQLIDVITTAPFSLRAFLPELAEGQHTLTIIAEDDAMNRRIAEVPFFLAAPAELPGVSFVERNASFSSTQFPRTLFLNPYKPEQIQKISIYLSASDGSNRTLVTEVTDFKNLFNNQLAITLKQATPGNWLLTAEVVLLDGTMRAADSLPITVQ
ncbi:MAG: PBP1A family penicillin-binding protein [Patescibacteria group bacterium]